MKKSDLVRDLRNFCGGAGCISKTELARFLNLKDVHGVNRYFHGLHKVTGRRYYIADVAENIIDSLE